MKRLCCLLLLFLLPIFASAEEFVLEVPDIKGFSLNEITVHSPVAGQLTLSVVTGTNTFFTWTADVSRDENTIEWNGLGYHNEVIPEGTYRIKNHMAEADTDTITAGAFKVTWKAVTSTRIDTTALRKDLPEVWQEYGKTTTTRRFSVALAK